MIVVFLCTVLVTTISYMYITMLFQGPILASEILTDICDELVDSLNPEAQKHAAGTIRNLTVGDHIRVGKSISDFYKYIFFLNFKRRNCSFI